MTDPVTTLPPTNFSSFLLDCDYDEFIPVDNFFDDYVRTLNGGPSVIAPNGNGAASTEASNPSLYQSLDAPPAPLPCLPGPADGFTGQTRGSPRDESLLPAYIPPPTTFANTFDVTRSDKSLPGSETAMDYSVATDHSSDDRPTLRAVNTIDGAKRGAGGVSKLSKGERQQMLNKAAQQRYRERKKAKTVKLEQAVEVLQDKVAELNVVEAEKRALKDKVTALERELFEKEAELSQLRDEVSVGQASCSENSTVDSKHISAELSQLVQLFHGYNADIRQFLVTHNLLDPATPIKVTDLPPEHVEALRVRTDASKQNCMRAHRLVTHVDTWAMIEASIDSMRVHFEGDENKWFDLVRRLCLSEDAIAKSHMLREQYLKKLETIYMDRQALNLMAVKLLLPEEVGGQQPTGRAAWFSFTGFFKRHKHTNQVAGVLGRLKANLMEEQRALGELDAIVLSHLLDPLQCAYAIVAAYPHHCDVVSLLNAVHIIHPPATSEA